MPCVPVLRSIRPLWLSAAVILAAGCQALVGDLPDPAELTGEGGGASDGGRTGSGGKAGSGGKGNGGASNSGGGASPAGGGSSNGGVAGGGNGNGGASVGGTSVDPPDGGDGGDGSVDTGGATGSGGTASGGAATGGVVGSGGAVGNGGAVGSGGAVATGGATGGTGGKGTAGSVTCTTDADGDGFVSKACGGNDCDDTDFDAKPGQTAFFEDPRNGGGYDYDCDTFIVRDPALNKTVDCSAVLSLCPTTAQGYFGKNAADVPQCGVSASWGTCAKNTLALLCEKAPASPVKMGCH